MEQAGRSVKHYHTDNGKFSDNRFVDAVNSKIQNMTFYRLGAHYQNSIIENKKKVLTTGAQTPLLHGIRILPQMIHDMFCPFAMKSVTKRLNSLKV